MPRTEASVNSLGLADRFPSPSGSFLLFLVRNPSPFNQLARVGQVECPVAYRRYSSRVAGPYGDGTYLGGQTNGCRDN